jgi:LDH2 family malate/lactate/ureidoglycolate dehydrogenase
VRLSLRRFAAHLAIADSAEIKRPRTPIAIVHETPLSARIDGGNQVGYVVMHRCTEIAIKKATANGVALIGAHNSWFSGRNAYYLERIAGAGFVGIHTVGATPLSPRQARSGGPRHQSACDRTAGGS